MQSHPPVLLLLVALAACSGPDGGDRGGAPALTRAAETPATPAASPGTPQPAPVSRLPTAERQAAERQRPGGAAIGTSGGQGTRSRFSRQDR